MDGEGAMGNVTFSDSVELPPFAGNEMALAAWAAGVVDGEGSITCSWSQGEDRPVPKAHSQMIVSQSGRTIRLLRVLSLLFGGNVMLARIPYGNRVSQFRWSLYGPRLLTFLKRIGPYLVAKSEQARLVIDLEERRALDGPPSAQRSPEFMAYATIVIDKMHELNWTGALPRSLSESPNNPKGGGRPRGVRNGMGKRPVVSVLVNV
jgi:hypothetical protein